MEGRRVIFARRRDASTKWCSLPAPDNGFPDTEATDEDIWRFLEWLIPRVGGEWTLEALKATGKVYKIPWA